MCSTSTRRYICPYQSSRIETTVTGITSRWYVVSGYIYGIRSSLVEAASNRGRRNAQAIKCSIADFQLPDDKEEIRVIVPASTPNEIGLSGEGHTKPTLQVFTYENEIQLVLLLVIGKIADYKKCENNMDDRSNVEDECQRDDNGQAENRSSEHDEAKELADQLAEVKEQLTVSNTDGVESIEDGRMPSCCA